ncbi:MAG: DUF2846 domain-containing protein [Ginsengibacter sp.]
MLYAQTDSVSTNSASTGSDKTIDTIGMAKVYVVRSTGHVASAVNLRVLIDDVMLCKIKNNRYAVFYVQPGTHSFNATSWDKPASHEKYAFKMPVEAGKTYYMSMRIKARFLETEIYLEEITYNTAAPLLTKYKQDKCD